MFLSSSSAFAALSITSSNTKTGTYGSALSYTINATGGVTPYSYSATGLPPGLTLTSGCVGTSCTITGTPTQSGTFSTNITVEDNSCIGDGCDFQTATKQLTFTLNPRMLTLTGSGVPAVKTYDGTLNNTFVSNTLSITGVLGDDVIYLNKAGLVGIFDTKEVGTNKTVTGAGLALGGADAHNYDLPTPQFTVTTGTITPKPVMVTGVTANNKVYDGTVSASLNTSSAAFCTGCIVAGDNVVLNTASATGAFTNKNVGNNKSITVSGIAAQGTYAFNYTVTQPTGLTASITTRTLTILSGVSANSKVYDRSNIVALAFTSIFSDKVTSDTIFFDTTAATGTLASVYVGNNKTVTVTGISIYGGDYQNYTMASPKQVNPAPTANVTPYILNVSGLSAASKSYNQSSAAVVTGTPVLSSAFSGDTVSLAGTAVGTFTDANAGNGKTVNITGFTLTGDNVDYALATPSQQVPAPTANITPINLTISGVTANNKTYNGSLSASLNTGGAQLSAGVLSGDDVTLNTTSAMGTFVSKNANASPTAITASGFALIGSGMGNYSLTQPTGLTALIDRAIVTVSGVTVNNKTYDATTAASLNIQAAVLSGVVSGEIVTLDMSGNTSAFADQNVGVGKAVTMSGLTLSGIDAPNYTLMQPSGGTANITPAFITVTANSGQTKLAETVDPILTYTGALFGSDTFTGALARAAGEAVGTYAISLGTLAAGANYSISFGAPVNFTITGSIFLTVDFDDGTNGTHFLKGGQIVDYTITISNSGSTGTTSPATIMGTWVGGLLDPVWDCTGSGGATCTHGPVTGNITNDLVTIPAGGTLTYLVSGTVQTLPEVPITNTVTINMGTAQGVDVNANADASSNSAHVTDTVGIFYSNFDF